MLERLVGAELAQVWFVRDYLQLIFEGDSTWSLQCWVWPRIRGGAGVVAFGEPAYRDSLCALIGEVVVAAEGRHGLLVEFAATRLVIDPSRTELEGPEIAMLHRLWEHDETMVWTPGDGPFEHLR